MKKIVFLYSGEGTQHPLSQCTVLKHSRYWPEIRAILNARFDLDLEEIWRHEIGRHRCPHSPLLTVVTQICLSDIWAQWGYPPDVVIGHSIGELAAAFQAGLYSLEDILQLTCRIGDVTSELEGVMLHGRLTDPQIDRLPVHLSALNFADGAHKHVTLSGYAEEMAAFLGAHPEFTQMKLPHPWHHPDYRNFVDRIAPIPSKKADGCLFVSGITAQFENRLQDDYWRQWMVNRVDFIGAMQTIARRFNDHDLEVIEIGFHPVLDKCCEIFERYTYVSSMFRGEDEVGWILYQRKLLDPGGFIEKLRRTTDGYKPQLDFNLSLAYQGFTSLTFVEFSHLIQVYFPSLAPQDFYRYKTINQLIDNFGIQKPVDTPRPPGQRDNDVVISGASCRFPASVENLTQFWEMLSSQGDQINANAARGDAEAGFLDDRVTRFDHKYFNIPEAEARTMDPQQILALELTELLWEDAGIDPQTLDRKRVGVYLGVWNQEFAGDKQSVFYPTGTNPSIIASRISYHFDLQGPSWVCNTACSSSLVAVHYAFKDIAAGRVDYAVAGGVNMLLSNDFTRNMRSAGFLSRDNRCKAFDEDANGYVRAEGGGLVLLANKALVGAYYAELKGSAINQNGGRSQVITAPHPQAQEELIRDACHDASIAPRDIAYIECHGTGTRIGDPIEISAIQNTVASGRQDKCFVGSVKSNMGHLESAAGIAGLIKSILLLNYGTIPPNLHYNRPNQFIDFGSYPLEVVHRATDIDRQAHVGVSSFGFGGANAHVILKGAADDVRKQIKNISIPFDRRRAPSLQAYFQPEGTAAAGSGGEPQPSTPGRDVGEFVRTIFFNLTNVKEIDPELELFEQDLDSLSATELINSLEQEYKLDLDPDMLFDYPLFDEFVRAVEAKVAEGG